MNMALRGLTVFLLRLRAGVEAALVGVFLVQALRQLVGLTYARTASASVYPSIDFSLLDPTNPIAGLAEPSMVSGELSVLFYMLLLPLLSLLLGRVSGLLAAAGVLTAMGRLLMVLPDSTFSPLIAAGLTVGFALFYVSLLVRQRMPLLPVLFVAGFSFDQLIRALGNTLDTSMTAEYFNIQLALSLLLAVLAVVNVVRPLELFKTPQSGSLSFWGGVALGAMLYLQLAVFASPNALTRRAGADYTLFAPVVMLATALPLLPWVRNRARGFIALFDPALRGWVWMLLIALLVVFGTRVPGPLPGGALAAAQFALSLTWWWLAPRLQSQSERSFSGLWLIVGVLTFALFIVFDIFIYEYAFVRDLVEPLTFLNAIVPPLLRGFRGLGLAVLLLGIFLAALPIIHTRQRIPWVGGPVTGSVGAALLVITLTAAVAYIVRPPVVNAVRDVDSIRVGTYNIHAGYNEFFHNDLEAIAQTIQQSGADVLLMQEVEAGRLTSFGVDQALWLARRLGMDVRFYATNEGLQGLAVLSRVEIVFATGVPLTSVGSQTGVQWVQVRPDEGVVTLYNTWLGLLLEAGTDRTLDQQQQDQQRQLDELLTFVASNTGPSGALGRLVIGGTFNNIPDSDLIVQMRQTGLTDPFESQPSSQSVTFIQTGREARLDYLWTNMLSLRAGVIDSRASDHGLAVVELQIVR